jgi:hypothetical protein
MRSLTHPTYLLENQTGFLYKISIMDEAKRKRLEQKGWKVGNVSEFLELTKEETALIETTKISEFFRQSPLAELTEELDLNRDRSLPRDTFTP